MQIPSTYLRMKEEYPDLMRAYESLGQACAGAGPLDERSVALVKLGISMGAGLEGAAHSHTRKALDAGVNREEILHAALLLTPTVGFPTMMRARSWVLDVLEKHDGQET